MESLSALRRRVACWSCFCLLVTGVAGPSAAQQISGIQSVTQRAFVTSVTPVFGPRGFVGGVSVDAQGVVTRSLVDAQSDLSGQWKDSLRGISDSLTDWAATRFVSLKKIDQHLAGALERGEPLTAEVFFLAGLQRIEYVFVDPDHDDIVLAGPAEGWRMADGGEVVGITTGRPVLRLDDLIDNSILWKPSSSSRPSGVSTIGGGNDRDPESGQSFEFSGPLLIAEAHRSEFASCSETHDSMRETRDEICRVISVGDFCRWRVTANARQRSQCVVHCSR